MAYKLQVTSDVGDGCGVAGQAVTLTVDGYKLESNPTWNNSQAWYTSLVIDSNPPTLSLPADMTVDATDSTGVVVNYTVTATDLVDPAPTVSCTPASGSLFPEGRTTVTCTATDANGNSSTGTQNVSVGYQFGGFQSPLREGGIYKLGRTIPVRISQ